MDASKLKYRITFQPPTITSNDFGTKQNVSYTGGTAISVWANKIDIGGNKTIANYELFTSQILQFEIRYRTDINETYRIEFEGKFYSIVAPFKSTEYRKNLIITAELIQ